MTNAEAQARWRARNPEKSRANVRAAIHKMRFGGNRIAVLERDKYACVKCGMSNDTHKQKWGREITIDHIDNQGRYSNIQNNNMDNLITLCLSCHGRKDSLVRHNRRRSNGESF